MEATVTEQPMNEIPFVDEPNPINEKYPEWEHRTTAWLDFTIAEHMMAVTHSADVILSTHLGWWHMLMKDVNNLDPETIGEYVSVLGHKWKKYDNSCSRYLAELYRTILQRCERAAKSYFTVDQTLVYSKTIQKVYFGYKS